MWLPVASMELWVPLIFFSYFLASFLLHGRKKEGQMDHVLPVGQILFWLSTIFYLETNIPANVSKSDGQIFMENLKARYWDSG